MSVNIRLMGALLALALVPAASALQPETPVTRYDQDCNLLVTLKLRVDGDGPQFSSARIAPPSAYKYLQLPYPGWIGTADLEQFSGGGGIHLHVRSTAPITGDPGVLAVEVLTEGGGRKFAMHRLAHCRYSKPTPAAEPEPASAAEPAAPPSPEPEAPADGTADAASTELPPQDAGPDAQGAGDAEEESTPAAPEPAPEAPPEIEEPADLPAEEEPTKDLTDAGEAPAPETAPEAAPEAGTEKAVFSLPDLSLPDLSAININWLSNKMLELGMHIRSFWHYILIAFASLVALLVVALLLSGMKRRKQNREASESDFPEDDFEEEVKVAFGRASEEESGEEPEAEPDEKPGEEPNAEVESQLDLATAYIQMGKHDMAKPLLDKILEGGTPEERAKAQELKERMAAD